MGRSPLKGTLTIRLDPGAARALRKRAQAEKRSTSDVVRTLIDAAVAEEGPTAMERSLQFVGAIRSGPIAHGRHARQALKQWKPDRRG